MRFWVREFGGWILIMLGLGVFGVGVLFLLNHFIVETGLATVIGFIIFRGGIHLHKVAVAARACMAAQEKSNPPRAPNRATERRPFPAESKGR